MVLRTIIRQQQRTHIHASDAVGVVSRPAWILRLRAG